MPNFPNPPVKVKTQGEANTALAASLPEVVRPTRRTHLKAVYVTYSANVSVDVTVTLNAGVGAAYDVRLATMSLVANRWGVYLPEVSIPLVPGDTIDVAAPAGGAGITATVQILLSEDLPTQDGEGGYQIEPQMGAR